MRPALAGLCLLLLANVAAGGWEFGPRMAVTDAAGRVFYHLEGSGRRHVAAADGSVAVAWEDDRDGTPQVYVALRRDGDEGFSPALRVSTGGEAYEPAIAALPGGRFALAWEQDGAVYTRLLGTDGLAPPLRLAQSAAGNATLDSFGGRLFVAWRERSEAGWFVKVAQLSADGPGQAELVSIVPVERSGLETQVLFPAIAVTAEAVCVAWEDRRAGHTRLLISFSADAAKSFGEPQHLNEFFAERNQYDKGSGVTRVSLASFGKDEILAAWMDKRRGGAGYGIYAALGGGDLFGPNERVHGAEGDRQPHYNPATAGNAAGDFVVAWDDFRRGDSDIWLSRYEDEAWSSDFAPAVASGSGEQTHPSIALDAGGRLHLVWLERDTLDAPGTIYYSLGMPRQAQ